MKKYLIGILLLSVFLLNPVNSWAQNLSSSTPIVWNTSGQGSISIQITGITGGGTITFACTVDNTNYVAYNLTPVGGTTPTSTTTTNGIWAGPLGPCNQFRTSISAGTATATQRTIYSVKSPGGGSGGGGSGTVTSVGLTAPTDVFDITGSPVTTSGTLALAFDTQTANTIFSGPTTGAAATPTFRSLVAADVPASITCAGSATTEVLFNNAGVCDGDAGFTYDPATDFSTLVGGLDLLITGVRLSAIDGVLTLLGRGDGSDENLTFDFDNGSANEIIISTTSGATDLIFDFGAETTFLIRAPMAEADLYAETDLASVGLSSSTSFTYLRADGDQSHLTLDGSASNYILMGDTGIRVSAASSIFTLLGLNGEEENLTVDLGTTANTVILGSETGVTNITWTGNLSPVSTTSRFIANGTTPTVANIGANSCGTTAATIAGNDNVGKVTVGATAGTACRITFTTAFINTPSCVVTNETSANLARAASTTTTADLSGTFVAADVLAYLCVGR